MLKVLSKNIIIYGSTNGIKSLVPFLMLPILTASITPEQYGELSLLETTILFLLPFIMLSINGAVNVEYFKLNDKIEYKKYVVNAILLSFISFLFFSCLLFLFKADFSRLIKLNENWVELLTLFAFLRVISTVLLTIFQASGKAKVYSYFSISQTLIDFSISYYLVVILKYDIVGRIIGVYFSFFLFSILAIYLLYKMEYFKYPLTFKYSKDILHFGIPLIPHAIGGVVLAMSDRYFISYFCENSDVGLYTVAYQVSAVLLLITTSVNQAWSPIFLKLMNVGEERKIKNIILFLLIAFFMFSIIVYFSSSFIYNNFVDIRFHESKKYFVYLLLGFTFQSFYFLFTNYLFFYKRTALLAMITIIGAIFNVILNYYLIKYYGSIGVAYSTAITWFLYFVCVYFTVLIINRKKKNEIE